MGLDGQGDDALTERESVKPEDLTSRGSVRRQHVTIDQAVRNALWGIQNADGKVLLGQPGGQTFDRRYLSAASPLPRLSDGREDT